MNSGLIIRIPLRFVMLAALVFSLTLIPKITSAQSDTAYKESFFCSAFGWAVQPIGWCIAPQITIVQQTNQPPTPPEVVAQVSEPIPPTVSQPPAATSTPTNSTTTIVERVVERVPVNEYITNEYVTNPTTVIQEVVEREIIREESRRQDLSDYVTADLFDKQVDGIYESIGDRFVSLKDSLETSLLTVTGSLRDSTLSAGLSGMVLQSTGTGVEWVATSSLGISGGGGGGGSSLFTDAGATTYLTSVSDNLAIGTTTANAKLTVAGDINIDNSLTNATISYLGSPLITASTTNYSYTFGYEAGRDFTSDTLGNIAIGYQAGAFASTSNADNNYYIGLYAGRENTGSGNNIIGYQAGLWQEGGDNNILGYGTAMRNTGGGNNIMGSFAGFSNTGGNNNIFGRYAGADNTGSFNNILGRNAGRQNNGNFNDFIGYQTARYIQSTSSVLVGTEAFYGGSTYQAINNVALGYRAGYGARTGANNNLLLGYQAADSLTTGANNIIIGYDVEAPSNTGDNQLNIGNLIFGTGVDGTGTTLSSGNVGIGTSSPANVLHVIGTGKFESASDAEVGVILKNSGTNGSIWQMFASNDSSAIGGGRFAVIDNAAAGNVIERTRLTIDSTGNIGIGTSSPNAKLTVAGDINIDSSSAGLSLLGQRVLYASSTNNSMAVGLNAGVNLSSNSNRSVAIGNEALQFSTGSFASNIVAIGYQAGQNTASTSFETNSVLIGSQAGQNNSNGNVTAVGWMTGQDNSGGSASLFGSRAGQLNTGTDVVAVGAVAGLSNTGYGMTFLGANAGQSMTGGEDSVFVGNFAGGGTSATHTVAIGSYALGSGLTQNNVVIGYEAGGSVNTGADNNLLIGYQAADSLTTGSNNLIIGYDIEAPSNTGDNQLNIGNLIFGTGVDGTGTTLSSGNVGVGTTTPNAKLTILGTPGESALNIASSSGDSLLYVASDGNVGIGTTTPTEGLDVWSTGSIRNVRFSAPAGTGAGVLGYRARGTNSAPTAVLAGDNLLEVLGAGRHDSGWSSLTAGMESYAAENFVSGSTGSYLVFATTPVGAANRLERLRIDPAGNVGIGTSTPTTKLTVAGIITPDANNTYSLGNSTYRWSEVFASNGVINTSDERLKENIATSTYGLTQLLALSPVSFTWIDAPEQGTKLGLLAQDVQLILPEIVQVGDDENKTLGVRYTEIIPVIINSIKELWETVTGNKEDIEALQERIEALESQLDVPPADVEEYDSEPESADEDSGGSETADPEVVEPVETATTTASSTEEVVVAEESDEEVEVTEASEDPEVIEEEVVEEEDVVEEIPGLDPEPEPVVEEVLDEIVEETSEEVEPSTEVE